MYCKVNQIYLNLEVTGLFLVTLKRAELQSLNDFFLGFRFIRKDRVKYEKSIMAPGVTYYINILCIPFPVSVFQASAFTSEQLGQKSKPKQSQTVSKTLQ